MSVVPFRRRIALLVAFVVAWVAGSSLGATEPARRASAAPLFQLEAAHAEYVPVLDGSKPITASATVDLPQPLSPTRPSVLPGAIR